MSYKSAMKKLDEKIVGVGGQANIQFTNIDQRFRTLNMDCYLQSSGVATDYGLLMQFNGDTGLNYNWVYGGFYGWNSAAVWGPGANHGQSSITVPQVQGTGSGASYFSSHRISIANYTSTSFYKLAESVSGFYQSTGPNLIKVMAEGWWLSTAAITSILLFPASGNFVAGSVASLYGVL